jgi:hypothetical protein
MSRATIRWVLGVSVVTLYSPSDGVPANFYGPAEGGSPDVSFALARPITFDSVLCWGQAGSRFASNTVGALP